MYILEAEKRDSGRKAQQLKKSGLIPGSVYGGTLGESLLIQVPQNEVKRLLKSKRVGHKVSLNVDGIKYDTLIKEIGRRPIGDQIEHLSFQCLDNEKMILSTAQIVLLNKEKVTNSIQQRLYELPYRAYPTKLVEKTVIDLEGMTAGTNVRVEDLDIAKNKNIELLVDADCLVLAIVGAKSPHPEQIN